MANEQAAQPEKVKLKVSQILEDLSNGIDRKGIRAKYNLSATDVARLFQDPALKGARVRTAPAFELEHDVEAPAPKTKAPAAEKKAPAKKKIAAQPAATASTSEEEDDTNTNETTEETSSEESTIKEVPDKKEEEVKGEKGMW